MASGHPFAIRYSPFALLHIPSFAGLVVLAGSLNPIPSRTRPLNFPAPMVVRLKTRESRSLPGLPRTEFPLHDIACKKPPRIFRGGFFHVGNPSSGVRPDCDAPFASLLRRRP